MHRNWRTLIRPKALEVDKLTPTYGKFVVEPLERGYAQTLGNSLRRVLLSSIRGGAITGVRMAALGRVVREDENKGKTNRRMVEQMQSALHEFQALPDVVEDVAEVVLNLPIAFLYPASSSLKESFRAWSLSSAVSLASLAACLAGPRLFTFCSLDTLSDWPLLIFVVAATF